MTLATEPGLEFFIPSGYEFVLDGTRYPARQGIGQRVVSEYPGKILIGDATRDSHPYTSLVAYSDFSGGIGIERLRGAAESDRLWRSTFDLTHQGHLTLAPRADPLPKPAGAGPFKGFGTLYRELYGVFGRNIYRYDGASWGIVRGTLRGEFVSVAEVDVDGVRHLAIAHEVGVAYSADGITWHDTGPVPSNLLRGDIVGQQWPSNNLSGTALSPTSVRLNWSQGPLGGYQYLRIVVTRQPAGTVVQRIGGLAAGTRTRTITGLTAFTNYQFTLESTNTSAGSGGSVNQRSVVNLRTPPNAVPTLGTVSNRTYTVGDFVGINLPEASGGNPPLTYTVTGLARGLAFDVQGRRIHGRITAGAAATLNCVYRVEDDDGDVATRSFTITIQAAPVTDRLPTLPTVSNRTYIAGSNVNFQLPAATGGDGTIQYAVSGLGRGLSFNSGTRYISGVISGTSASTLNCRYTATDQDGDVATSDFTITIAAQGTPVDRKPELPSFTPPSGWVSGTNVNFQLPAATGGDAPLSYRLTGMPPGLAFNVGTRVMSGTLGGGFNTYNLVYTVTDNDGDTDEARFQIQVATAIPTLPAINDVAYDHGAVVNLQLPAATGGDAPLVYSLAGLPALSGLSFSPSTRRITGTVSSSVTGRSTLTYKVTDADGSVATRSFGLTLRAVVTDRRPTLPASGPYTRIGAGRISATLPVASGGDPPLSYSTSESDPDGSIVSFDASTRAIVVNIPTVPATLSVTYRVKDVDGDIATRTVEFRTLAEAQVPPGRPSAPSVAAGRNLLEVSWHFPSSEGSQAVTSFDLRHRTGSGSWTTIATAWQTGEGALNYTIRNLTAGEEYEVQVRAVSPVGPGAWSLSGTNTPTSASVPGTPNRPTLVSASASRGTIIITWNVPSSGGSPLTAYHVAERVQGAGWSIFNIPPDERQRQKDNAIPGTTYEFRVRARNDNGNGGWSPIFTYTLPAIAPGVPLITSATPGDETALITWNEPASNGGAEITEYDLRHRTVAADGTTGSWVEVDRATMGLRSFTITGLTNDTSYEVQVRAQNSVGPGNWSASQAVTPTSGSVSVSVIIQQPPMTDVEVIHAPPAQVVIARVEGFHHALLVEWEEPSSASALIDYYDVQVRNASTATRPIEEATWTSIFQASVDTTHRIPGLANGVEYQVRVRAVNSVGAGPWSEVHPGTPISARIATAGFVKMVEWDYQVWGITQGGVLYSSFEFSDGWTERAKLPEYATPVTDMLVYRDAIGEPVIFVITEIGVWTHDVDNERFVQTSTKYPRRLRNGRGAAVWRDDLYIPAGLEIYRYQGGSQPVLSLVGPDRDQGVPWVGEGRIELSASHNSLLAAVVNEEIGQDPIGTSHILSYDAVSWQVLWDGGDVHRVLEDVHVASILGEYSVWFAYEENGGDNLAVIDLPTAIVNPSMPSRTRRYAPQGYALTPWIDADEAETRKLGLEIKAQVAQVTLTEVLQVQYALDYAELPVGVSPNLPYDPDGDQNVWRQLPLITPMEIERHWRRDNPGVDAAGRSFSEGLLRWRLPEDLPNQADGNREGMPFQSIRFRIVGVSGAAERSPDLLMIGLEFKKHLDLRWGFTINVDLNNEYGGLQPHELRERLKASARKIEQVKFSFRKESGSDVDEVYWVDIDSEALLQGSGSDDFGNGVLRLTEL